MQDKELLKSSRRQFKKIGLNFWLYWPPEMYSFGKIYRMKYKFFKFAPLIFYSDHGVTVFDHLDPHEKFNKARYHLTFSKIKYENNRLLKGKTIKLVEHPYLFYRKQRNFTINGKAKGTVIFIPHSNPGIDEKIDLDLDTYWKKISLLDEKFKPFTFCVHMHDCNQEFLSKLRKYGIPIVSAGNSMHEDFVDRFYEIISNFKFATSSDFGSHSLLCEEFGIKFFIYGLSEKMHEENRTSPGIYHELIDIFKIENLNDKVRKDYYLDLLLGRNSEKTSNWNYPRIEYFIDFVRLFPRIVISILISVTRQVRRIYSK
jgi:hypothetical protein